MKTVNMRLMLLLVSALMALALSAQTTPDLTRQLNQSGQVAVEAPQGLTTRNNASLLKPEEPKKPQQKAERRNEEKTDQQFNEIDDETKDRDKDKDKDKDKEKTDRPKQPKRERTTQQTIQARSVGYRIQAYTDNNQRTAKASAQQRARAIAMKFPQYRSYISYNAPSWRLRIGDFKSRSEAQAALARIRSVFPSYAREMTIVRDHINVWQ